MTMTKWLSTWTLSVACFLTLSLSIAPSSTASDLPPLRLIGVSPALRTRLETARSFSCDNSQKSFDLQRLNDNYCDCNDGSDEPGTSACSHTLVQFYCVNDGFFARSLPTSRVNDNICDCCDGSDEYDGHIQCENTCATEMQSFRHEKESIMKQYEAGLQARAAMVENVTAMMNADRARLESLQQSLESQKVIVEQTMAVRDQEELEETREKSELAKSTKLEMLQTLGLSDLSKEQLGFIILELANTMYSKDDLLKFIRVERGALGSSLLEKEEEAYKAREAERQKEIKRIDKLKEEKRKKKEEAQATEDTSAEQATEEEELKYPEVEERPVRKMFDRMKEFQQHERPAAKEARQKFNEAQQKLQESENEIRELEKGLGKAYGSDNILYSLRGECVDVQSGQYKYSMCFEGQAKQDAISLGRMQEYKGGKELLFTGGIKCWNGPERSLKVTLECGPLPMELSTVEEPSTCVYTASLRTPVACDPNEDIMPVISGQNGGPSNRVEIEVAPVL